MSTASRLISGSAASWAQIVVTVIAQMALVPLYLSHWDVATYGVWLAIQALVSVMSLLDLGHQEFLGYEFLRLGRQQPAELGRYLWSGVAVGIFLSLIQIALIIGFLLTGALPTLLGKPELLSADLLRDAGLVLLLQGLVWLFCTSTSGLLFRALAPFGYFPRMAWWGLLGTIMVSVTPAVAVVLGAGLLATGLVLAATATALTIPVYADLGRLLRRENIPFSWPSLQLGYTNLLHSLAITGKIVLENARQQGVRLVLAPLSGAVGLAAFSTMRTGANVALQGLNTVVNPLMPELMRFLHQRDQERSEAGFGTVWVVLVALMAPATVLLQALVEPLYLLWTRGKVPFDPSLFAMLSLGVLVYALAQPAMAVVKGNNLLKAQLALSALAAVVVVGGMFVLVPWLGILGAGVALLLAEIAATIGYGVVARGWLHQNGLRWPSRPFLIAAASVGLSALAMAAMIALPQARWLVLVGAQLLLGWNIWRYWQVLPTLATQHAGRILGNLPGMKKLFPA